jgi:hypothetical protein
MKNLFNIGFVVLILVVLGCNCSKLDEFTKGKSTPPPPSSPPANVSPTPAPIAPSAPGTASLTLAKFKQIKKGMKRSEVEALFGLKGEETSSNSGGGHTYSVNKWMGPNYSYVIITFDNDKVYLMSQGGLK